MNNLSELIGATDAFIGTIKSFLKIDKICKIDVAWLMYFLSNTLPHKIKIDSETKPRENSNELLFLQWLFADLNTNIDKEHLNLSGFFKKIKNSPKSLINEFESFNINDAYFIDSEFNDGKDFIYLRISDFEKPRKKTNELLSDNLSVEEKNVIDYNASLSEYDKKLPVETANLYVFFIILVVAIRNNIPIDQRVKIYMRLNTIFNFNFKDFLNDFGSEKLAIDLGDIDLQNCSNQNDIVRAINNYIFNNSVSNNIESNLISVSAEMFKAYLHFSNILNLLRKERGNINNGDLILTKDELKYGVAYWLLGTEYTTSVTGKSLGNKNENFYYWIFKVSEQFVTNKLSVSK